MLIQTGTHCTQHPGQHLHAHEFLKCSCRDCIRCVSCGSCTETSWDQHATSRAPLQEKQSWWDILTTLIPTGVILQSKQPDKKWASLIDVGRPPWRLAVCIAAAYECCFFQALFALLGLHKSVSLSAAPGASLAMGL